MSFLLPNKKDKKTEETENVWEERNVQTLPVNPEIVKKNILLQYFTTAVTMDEHNLFDELSSKAGIDEIEKMIHMKAENLHKMIKYSQASLGQLVMTVIDKKTLRASVISTLNTIFNELILRVNMIRSGITESIELLRNPNVPTNVKVVAYKKIVDELIDLLSIPDTTHKIIKDVEGIININLPYHLKSDLVRKMIGYTGT